MTELIDAVRANDLGTVKRLLAEGADVEDMGLTGDTPLVEAAARGYTLLVEVLLDGGALIEDDRRISYVLPLKLIQLQAEREGKSAIAPVNAVVAAALGGHVDTVMLLEERLPPLPNRAERWMALRYARHVAKLKSASAH